MTAHDRIRKSVVNALTLAHMIPTADEDPERIKKLADSLLVDIGNILQNDELNASNALSGFLAIMANFTFAEHDHVRDATNPNFGKEYVWMDGHITEEEYLHLVAMIQAAEDMRKENEQQRPMAD